MQRFRLCVVDNGRRLLLRNLHSQKIRDHPFPPRVLDVYISCHPGLETCLSEELTHYGMKHTIAGHGAKLKSPTKDQLLQSCLWLGTASQVTVQCGKPFVAPGFAELKRKVRKRPWSQVLSRNVQLQSKVSSSKSKLYHTEAIRERMDAAIYDALGESPNGITEMSPRATVNLRGSLLRDKLQISLSSSDTPLHRRSYRLQTGKAPLREDIAYALLWKAGLRPPKVGSPHLVEYDAILDPFCGSGTLAIEALSMLSRSAPGRLRSCPFDGTVFHDPALWDRLMMVPPVEGLVLPSVHASDRDAGVIKQAKCNEKRAGLQRDIDFRVMAFSKHPFFEAPAAQTFNRLLIVSNLPFGIRTTTKSIQHKGGHRQHNPVLPMYQKLRHNLKQLAAAGCKYRSVFLTNEPTLLTISGIKAESILDLSLGNIRVSAMMTCSD